MPRLAVDTLKHTVLRGCKQSSSHAYEAMNVVKVSQGCKLTRLVLVLPPGSLIREQTKLLEISGNVDKTELQQWFLCSAYALINQIALGNQLCDIVFLFSAGAIP